MADPDIVGPFRTVTTSEGVRVPWYIMPFDADGRLQGPRSRDLMIQDLAGGDHTDIVIFCHGWNNDWDTAEKRYVHFLEGFSTMRASKGLGVRDDFRPLLCGLFWPSTALVMPWERPPRVAADPVDEEQPMLEDLAGQLSETDGARLGELISSTDGLDPAMARELAGLVQTASAEQDDIAGRPVADADELVEAWRASLAQYPSDPSEPTDLSDYDEDDYGRVDTGAVPDDVAAAGFGEFLGRLDPRKVLRLVTVLRMKDRAGLVGSRGVADLLEAVLGSGGIRVHLIGHSYGAKVVMTALCAAPPTRPVSSALLLQPAVSRYCFAADLGAQRSGGFRRALARTELPILSTFSRRDAPLRQFFHLAARRKSDIGEIKVAGGAESLFAALGGYGPSGLGPGESSVIPMGPVGHSYGLKDRAESLLGIEGHEVIRNHGDISNDHTWWAMYELLAAS